ncbi:hypothetical protein AMOR_05390 [Anaeromyxobacter oryzae]|uniref:Leucine-rich repeat domain-containing protein n=2 Tax=Anaeromyxobacter oryzae TaxID=2918170 RepID=A0ABM7WPZ9_9BACT|nr:hypothetical protein AMOR_05390 [Anaeromyxobacter oryzae]
MRPRPTRWVAFVVAIVASQPSAAAEPAAAGNGRKTTITVTVDELGMLSSSDPALARVKELRIDATCTRTLETAVPLPATLGDLATLEALHLGPEGRQDCDLVVTLPANLAKLKKLKTLRADDAFEPTYAVPSFIGELSALENLGLMRSHLAAVPDFVGKLKRLRLLTLWRNEIRVVPEFLAELPELEEIDLSYNEVHRLPPVLAKARALRRIRLGNNHLTLAEQEQLRREFPNVAFDFANEYDDGVANDEASGR